MLSRPRCAQWEAVGSVFPTTMMRVLFPGVHDEVLEKDYWYSSPKGSTSVSSVSASDSLDGCSRPLMGKSWELVDFSAICFFPFQGFQCGSNEVEKADISTEDKAELIMLLVNLHS